MEFANSTCVAAATLLPHALPQAFVSNHDRIGSALIPLDPWGVFNYAWTRATGYQADDFAFTPGQTPLSTLKESASLIALYYVVVFGGRGWMRDKPALKLNTIFIIHNFYLTILSGCLLILFVQQLIPSLWNLGLYSNICEKAGWTNKLVVLYYLNYLTKYLELIDTVFLVLKKKPLTFLHTYHHGATALLCYTQLAGGTSVSWVPITLNLMVHVVMYWYYYQAARGVKVWWKQYITILQILQFVLDLGAIYFATYTYFAHTYAPFLPHVGSCGETRQELAALTGCAILSSYLVLFVIFYISTYKKQMTRQPVQSVIQVGNMEVNDKDGKISSVSQLVTTSSVTSMRDELLTSVAKAEDLVTSSCLI